MSPALAVVALVVGSVILPSLLGNEPPNIEGTAPHPKRAEPSVEAAFQAESYAPGSLAALRFFNLCSGVRLQLFHAGPEGRRVRSDNELGGIPVSGRSSLGPTSDGRIVRIRIGDWPSGVYFARLDAADGRAGFAPFLVRPARLGEHRVAVVMPTFTWQAYNRRDDDGDGVGNTWYADYRDNFARLYRPHLSRGVPYHFRSYDRPFLKWLDKHDFEVDFLADSDLDRIAGGDALARAYDLILFPGHHEYVTASEYDAIEGYRDRGGNLAFLSANNFFYRVSKRGPVLERTKKWRDLGRPEAALVGVQYTSWKRAFGRYVVRATLDGRWLFRGTGLEPGDTFGHGGIEVDAVSSSSPRNIQIVARIPDAFGPGMDADMTVYRTRAGGTVFAAGAFTMAGASLNPLISRILENLWKHMTS